MIRDNIRSLLPGLRRVRTVPFSDSYSSPQIKVTFHFIWIQVAWSPGWRSYCQWWCGVSCHLLVLVHWQILCFSLLTSFVKMLISISTGTLHLPTVPKPLLTSLVAMVLLWLTDQLTYPTLTPQIIFGVMSRGTCVTRSNNTNELKADIKTAWTS